MATAPQTDEQDAIAALEHLTGPSRGAVSWLSGADVVVTVGPDRKFRLSPAEEGDAGAVARIARSDQGFTIEALGGHHLWLNGRAVGEAGLHHGDMIEFGETGPMSRFRSFSGRRAMSMGVDAMLGDSVAYLRSSRKPMGRRITWAAGDFGRRLLWETTLFFRITVIIAIIGLGYLAYTQFQTSRDLAARLAEETERIEGIEASVARTRAEALRPGDLAALREELANRVTSAVERVEALEEQSQALARVIRSATPSIGFLQGAYGLRHTGSGAMLRHVLNDDGIPIMLPTGRPLLSLEGDGPIAEVQFTGTGFLVGDAGRLVTNRHVARPWESSADAKRLAARSLEPVLLKFHCYFPGRPEPVAVTADSVSDLADLAILTLEAAPEGLKGLSLADAPPDAGDEILVMGYPTGLRAMLAQSGAAFVKELQDSKDTDFWSVARRLARADLIRPLASRGIVGQVTREAVVYDAETTHGGSGGPVFDADGAVIAVNAAILPEFGGSNLGVPVAKLKALLDSD